ncbi:MAG: ATP-binding protein [Candidatus Izemoplasma sp.]
MNINKNYIYISFAYLVVAIFTFIFSENIFGLIFIGMLFIYHIYSITSINNKLSEQNKSSVKSLKSTIKKVERKGDEAYHQFISLSQTLGSGLIMIDQDGIINYANKDVVGYFLDSEIIEDNYKSFLAIKPLNKFINEAYLAESNLRKQVIYYEKYYDLISTPIFEDGLFKGCLIIIHDITIIKNAEKFQKQFTADVSHELKTPLSVIKGFSELIERDSDMDTEQRNEFFSLIKKESERMECILNDLLVISKMDRLDYEMKFNNIDIDIVILESIDHLKSIAKDKDIIIESVLEKVKIDLDISKIKMVFTNIIKNAINYTDEGTINIKGYVEDNNYIIKIKDSGIGIDGSQFDNIFKRFYRIDNDRSRETGGSGLGLSISKNVVSRHGGEITLESVTSEGTTFTIKLPIKK